MKRNRDRKRARRALEKKGAVKPFDGKEVDHRKALASGGSNSVRNLKVTSRTANRRKQPRTKPRGSARSR